MGLGFQFITILGGIYFFQSVIALAGGCGCLKCHEAHYEEKGACIDCHRGNPGTERVLIAHHNLISAKYAHFSMEGSPILQRGSALVTISGCRRCHVIGAKGNRLATNLGRVFGAARPQRLFDAIKTPVPFMPNFCFKESHIIELINAILAEAARAEPEAGETPLVIHFEDEEEAEEGVFGKHCGPCHKVLTRRLGGQGKGDIGPNLSGLFSEHYPKTYGDKEPWSPRSLKNWLENPRQISKIAQMPPVKVTSDEFSRLLEILGAGTFTIKGKGRGKNEG
ncbi:MAG: selenite/tellurite reduction operon c-type cytochrome lipoprotein ExtS [Thermodesulfobacteriota bacterium]|nr:selenite/tellurite reduction operon c-type cytochrome lipoprotein ExtS [Thermodesulfobacteriota bacterium]